MHKCHNCSYTSKRALDVKRHMSKIKGCGVRPRTEGTEQQCMTCGKLTSTNHANAVGSTTHNDNSTTNNTTRTNNITNNNNMLVLTDFGNENIQTVLHDSEFMDQFMERAALAKVGAVGGVMAIFLEKDCSGNPGDYTIRLSNHQSNSLLISACGGTTIDSGVRL